MIISAKAVSDMLGAIDQRSPLAEMDVLEVFGRKKQIHRKFYVNRVKSVTTYTRKAEFARFFAKTFPSMAVMHGDPYQLIRDEIVKFDLVFLDNFMVTPDHVEHFDLFPAIYDILKDRAYIVRNVIVSPDHYTSYTEYKEETKKRVDGERRLFYSNLNPRVTPQVLMDAYETWANTGGFNVTWTHAAKRNNAVAFYTEELVRQ